MAMSTRHAFLRNQGPPTADMQVDGACVMHQHTTASYGPWKASDTCLRDTNGKSVPPYFVPVALTVATTLQVAARQGSRASKESHIN